MKGLLQPADLYSGIIQTTGAPTGPGIGASSTIRKGDWKLIYYHENQNFELFNLTEDIGETTNLAEKESEKLREMAGLLADYLRKVEAQMPVFKKTGEPVPYPDQVLNDMED